MSEKMQKQLSSIGEWIAIISVLLISAGVLADKYNLISFPGGVGMGVLEGSLLYLGMDIHLTANAMYPRKEYREAALLWLPAIYIGCFLCAFLLGHFFASYSIKWYLWYFVSGGLVTLCGSLSFSLRSLSFTPAKDETKQ